MNNASLLADHIFAADPSAHVFENRLYLYVSYDEPGTNSYDSMVCYHVLSTDDLINWVDHGRVLHLDQVDWALSHMWAIDANYFNELLITPKWTHYYTINDEYSILVNNIKDHIINEYQLLFLV